MTNQNGELRAVESDLFNYGVARIRGKKENIELTQKTYVVLGVSRGGTSAISGLLNQFGVFMGHSGRAPLFENLKINKALRGSEADAELAISEFNKAHDVWGFKGNAIPQPYSELSDMLRNPVYIVIFRDVFAIANRAKISADREILSIMEKQALEYVRIIEFVKRRECDFILVSYEKLICYPEAVVTRIAEFMEINTNPSMLSAAIEFIEPAPSEYLEVSKAKK